MGSYRLIKRLAVGGMAEVFLGKIVGVEGFEKPVAIKRILPSYGRDGSFNELFLREARLSVLLQHANVVQVLDLGSLEGRPYMVMEFVDGENLRTLLRAAQALKVVPSLREACFITQQVAEGLAYAHSRTDRSGAPLNIVHRDVNPSNVMITSSGEVKLADFGIAKATDGHEETQSGILKGKINYLSPEQVLGHPVDQRSDIFLLGLLLYELLSGRQLFDGSSLQIVQRVASFDARMLAPLPGVPGLLWAIVQRALAATPEARFRTAREFSEALQSFLFDHRLRVGTSEIASLFARAFPDRRSPLDELTGNPHEEIRLEGDPIASTPSRRVAAGNTTSIRATRRPHPPLSPPVLRPVSTPPSTPVPLAAQPPLPVPQPGAPRKARESRRIGEILLARGAVSREGLEAALTLQHRTGRKLGQVLSEEGLADPDQVVRALSEQSGLPSITGEQLQAVPIPRGQVRAVPEELCERLCAVPVEMRGRQLYCAVRDPRDLAVLDALKFATGVTSVQGLFASEPAIRSAIRRFYRGCELRVPEEELAQIQFLHKRLLDGAMALLGGCAVMEPYLVRLARCTAARMGATRAEESLAGAAASVVTLAARLQEPRRFVLPEPLGVQALVGSEFPEISALLSSVLPVGCETRPLTGRVESATLCAVAFAQEIQCVHPGPEEAARALRVLRQNPRLPPAALEALATELGANVSGGGSW